MKSATIILNNARQWTRYSTSPMASMRSSVLTLLLLACVGASSKVQAVCRQRKPIGFYSIVSKKNDL